MESLLINGHFDASKNYEAMNLSYLEIKDLDFTKLPLKCSFYRSDFRGTKFESDIFCGNNFDLADFISNSFRYVEFHTVNFGNSEFKNCFLRNCLFEKNDYSDIAMHGCSFSECTFRDEEFKMTMLNCKFKNCTFINCTFNQCSTDSLAFDGCIFLKCELSTMHAENFTFSNCTFRDAYLGLCFIGTYLFKNTDLDLILFKYRGNVIDINSSSFFEVFQQELLKDRRYFEYFNLSILFHNDKFDELVSGFGGLIIEVMKEPNPNVLEYNLSGIFNSIEFYLGSENLSLLQALRLVEVLHSFPLTHVLPDERLFFLQNLYNLDLKLSSLDYSPNYIQNIPNEIPCMATIHCNDNSVADAEGKLHSFFDYINKEYLGSRFEPPYFETVSYQNGSIILTITSSLMLLLLGAKVINATNKSICEIRLENAKTKKAIELISASKTPVSFQNALATIPPINTNTSQEQSQPEKIFGMIGNSYIIDYVIHYFLK